MRNPPAVPCCMLLAAAFAVTLGRAARLANDWAEAHWLLDYRFGFVKRALPGQILTWATDLLGVAIDANVIAIVSIAIAAGFCALLFAIACRVARLANWNASGVAAALVFATSPFVVSTGNLVGYYDHVFFAMGLASVWLALRGRTWAGAAIQCATLLVHESSVVLVYPVFAFACLLRGLTDAGASKRVPWPALLLPLAAAVAVGVALASQPPAFRAQFAQHLRGFPFVENDFASLAPGLLAFSLADALVVTRAAIQVPMYHDLTLRSVLVVLPSLIALLAFAKRWTERGATFGAAVAIVLLPQALHVVAFDIQRIWPYSIFVAFTVIWCVAERRPSELERWRAPLLVTAVVATCVNLLCEVPLIDLVPERLPLSVRAVALVVLLGAAYGITVARSRHANAAR